MASNKTSIYDGVVHVTNGGSLDLTGKIGLAMGAFSAGAASVRVDNGTEDWVVGDKVYACESSGDGRLKLVGEVASTSVNSGTAAGDDLDITLTLTSGAKISAADNTHIVKNPPKFEISAIQIIVAGALSNLIPVLNYYPGNLLSNGTTSWVDEPSVSYYGSKDGSSGAAFTSSNLEAGITIEGRWKHVTMSSSDACLCYLKAVPLRAIN